MKKAHGAAIALSLALGAWAGEPELVFEDRFEEGPGEGWSWLRENKDAWRVRDGALEIRVEPGAAGTVKNALLRKAPERGGGKYAVEVTVTALSAPVQQFEQAGITWYFGGKPGFKFVKELVDGKLYVVAPGKKVPMESGTVQLRLEVTAEAFRALYRPEAKGEYLVAAEGKMRPPGEDQVSLQCYHGPPEQAHWFRFDDFRIWKLPTE